jgi:hypothetical protein
VEGFKGKGICLVEIGEEEAGEKIRRRWEEDGVGFRILR